MRLKCRLMACSAIFIMPWTGRISPSKASSPTKTVSARSSRGNCLVSARMATAIGRSSQLPVLGSSAGARFTVILSPGKMKPELRIAERIRSRLSSTVRFGIPTIKNEFRERVMSLSTDICLASKLSGMAECVVIVFMTLSIGSRILKEKRKYDKLSVKSGADKV